MIATVLEALSHFIIYVISVAGYPGIVLLMAIESACIPLPSEVIMPFSGYLVFTGRFNLWWVAVAGALGCNVGSIAAYWVGYYGGRPLVERYGRYVLVSRHDLEMADRWFKHYGQATVFFARLLPVIRTFIALPAGVMRMDFLKFNVYTFLGSLPWCLALAWAGLKLGEHWQSLRGYFHRFDVVIGLAIAAGVAWFLWSHLRNRTGNNSRRAGRG
jgi:membrane protein DedA with SNARE-associated domain